MSAPISPSDIIIAIVERKSALGLIAQYREQEIRAARRRAARNCRRSVPAALDPERLAVAMNTAQLTCDEIRLGRDLRVPAERIAAAYRDAKP